METKFTVAICTRNRAELLNNCLNGLVVSTSGQPVPVPVMVVDNGSTDRTSGVVSEFLRRLDVTYLYEGTPGLSRARNMAWRSCETDYIVFLDDDAKPLGKWISAIEKGIKRWHPNFFGGPFRPYYLSEKPQWFDDAYGSAYLDRKEGPLSPNTFVSGGNMGWRISTLRDLGGFPENLGMIGDRMGIGEETYLQRRARAELGVEGHFLPEMEMLHYVPPEKMKLAYRARRMWQAGWQDQDMRLSRRPFQLRTLAYEIGSLPVYFVQMFFRDKEVDPHWQNWVYRKFCPRLHFWGRFAHYWTHVVAQILRRDRVSDY